MSLYVSMCLYVYAITSRQEIAFYTFDEIYSWGASDLQVLLTSTPCVCACVRACVRAYA